MSPAPFAYFFTISSLRAASRAALLYDLASSRPDQTFMYLHTKGMSYNITKRSVEEKTLLAGTFGNWRDHLKILRDDSSVNKIGLFPGKTSEEWKGWIWFNFFIARGSYLRNCENPVVTDDRYYYEGWIGMATKPMLMKIATRYSQAERTTSAQTR